MNQHEHHGDRHEPVADAGVPHHGPYWRRAHRDWRFWVGVAILVGAMFVYVFSENLAFRPRVQRAQPQQGSSVP